jgi:hypothetical protein
VTQAPLSKFKELIVTSPMLRRGLHNMSMLKTVPDGTKARECEWIKLREPPPVSYVPVKDEVQDEVARMCSMEIKTTIEKDTMLNFSVWQENGTCKAFLMHVTAVIDAIKKRGHFEDYKKAAWKYKEAKEAVESARAGLSLLENSIRKANKEKKKTKEKTKEGKNVALANAPEPKSAAREAEVAPVADDQMKASFSSNLEKAKQSQRIAKGAMTAAASKMFLFYSNLLSPESKYAWNKIISKQTEGNPYINLQDDTLEGPRGMLHQLFHDCVMFHLLTVFPINAAEQEKYYILNVLKKPQCINVHQFVRWVEQLNAYIAQMPCFYYSPHANASTKPENYPFPVAELGAHVLRMCPLPWQDQYNLNQKGMTPMDMRMLLTLLEAIERICTHEKGKLDEESEKSSYKGKKGKKRPGTDPTAGVPKKVWFEKHCGLCKKHGGAHNTHTTRECHKYEKDGTEKSSFRAAKKGGKKNYPVNQNFAQLTKKIKKLEKALKKSRKKARNAAMRIAIPTPNRKLGWVALGKS